MVGAASNPIRPSWIRFDLIEYLRLFRVSNVFTAASNILAGFLLAGGSWSPVGALILLVLASCCFYFSGMILNDVFDFEKDKQTRPKRPLPSGAIPLTRARALGVGMLVSGILMAALAGLMTGEAYTPKPLIVGIILAIMIWLYDGGGKSTILGPALMGSCRTLNVLLGCSIAQTTHTSVVGFELDCLVVATGVGIYICGVTTFARREAESSSLQQLTTGMSVAACGLVLIALVPVFVSGFGELGKDEMIFMITIGMILFVVLRRMIAAITSPSPQHVQVAVIVSLISLIMIDAAVCFYAAPDNLTYCVTVALLMLPTFVLARWISPT